MKSSDPKSKEKHKFNRFLCKDFLHTLAKENRTQLNSKFPWREKTEIVVQGCQESWGQESEVPEC